jgi:Fur family ferric uptake transcriptional regulator
MAFFKTIPTDIISRMEDSIRTLLKGYGLSITDSRREVLQLFYNNNGAMAHADIEKQAGNKMDRVTIYRTLQTFEERGIIHSIPSADNVVRYALCKEQCADGHHHDNHVHFLCNACGKTSCLENVIVPKVKLPLGFLPSESNMVVKGICNLCRA